MYLPEHFAENDLPTLHRFMRQFSFATLVTHHEGAPYASHLPFLLAETHGPLGALRAHTASKNPQWRDLAAGQQALVIFLGPHSYVSPSWYRKRQNVPTWNYTAVHAYGTARILSPQETLQSLLDLAHLHEAGNEPAWSFNPQDSWIRDMLSEIVGFEISIDRLEGKFKLSQNRTGEDRESVVRVLAASERLMDREIAEFMAHLVTRLGTDSES